MNDETARLVAQLKCERTKNLVGTDTRMLGEQPCMPTCVPCRLYLLAFKEYMAAEERATQVKMAPVKATLLLHHDASPEQGRVIERFAMDLLRTGASVTLQGAPFDGTWRKPQDKMPEPEEQILLYDSYGVRLGRLTQSRKWFYSGAANDYETSKAPDYWCQIPPLAP